MSPTSFGGDPCALDLRRVWPRYTSAVFTGIVEALGTIVGLAPGHSVRRLEARTRLPVEDMALGASLAVEGVCLTLVAREAGWFAADLGPETLQRTTLGRLRVDDGVHLERPLAIGDALGGHWVTGHVDGVGEITAARAVGDAWVMDIRAPATVARYLVTKGSITVAGVSLTINEVVGDCFSVGLIPHTVRATTLAQRPIGDPLNLEADLVAKHVDRSVGLYMAARGFAGPTEKGETSP